MGRRVIPLLRTHGFCLAAALVFSRHAAAEVLKGNVTDPSGAAVTQARVAVSADDRKTGASTAYTDALGNFTLTGLLTGSYTLRVDAANFEPAERPVKIPLGDTAPLRITLTVRAGHEQVTVTDRTASYGVSANSAALKTNTPLVLTPQSVQVVSRSVLEDQAAITLTDAVRNVAGVSSDFSFNGNAQPLLVLRGFPSASMTARGPMSGASTYYEDGTKLQGVPINIAAVQEVEVVKGPASVLYGRAEPGGLVNVVPRPLFLTPHYRLEEFATQFGANRSIVELDHPLNAGKTLFGRFAGSWLHDRSNRDFVRNILGAATGVAAWRPDARTELNLQFDYSNQAYRNDYGVPALGNRPANLPWSRQYNNSPDLSSVDSQVFRVQASRELSTNWNITGKVLSLWGGFSELDLTPYRFDLKTGDSCLAASGSLCRFYFYVSPDGKNRINQTNVDLKGRVRTGKIRHDLVVGFDYYSTNRSGTSYFQTVSSINVLSPVFTPVARLNTATALPSEIVNKSRWTSGYVQDVADLGYGVRVMAGARFEGTSAIFAEPGTPPNRQNFVTPRAAVLWEFRPQRSVYFQFQDAISANNGRDPSTGVALAPEKARQFELGTKATVLHGALSLTVAAYQLTKKNRADYSLYPMVRALGDARSRGFEFNASGRLTTRLSGIASYSYIDSIISNAPQYQGTALANVPRHSGSLWLRYAPTSNWSLGAGNFAQTLRQGNVTNSFQLQGYSRTDAMTAYQFHFRESRASVQLNVNNILDRKYYTGSHQLVSDWIQVSAPRTFALTLRWEI